MGFEKIDGVLKSHTCLFVGRLRVRPNLRKSAKRGGFIERRGNPSPEMEAQSEWYTMFESEERSSSKWGKGDLRSREIRVRESVCSPLVETKSHLYPNS